jgi:hypothetical protein
LKKKKKKKIRKKKKKKRERESFLRQLFALFFFFFFPLFPRACFFFFFFLKKNTFLQDMEPLRMEEDEIRAPRASWWKRVTAARVLTVAACCVFAANVVLAVAVVAELRTANGHASRIDAAVAEAREPATRVMTAFDSVSVLLTGSVPDLANRVLRKDYASFGAAVVALARNFKTAAGPSTSIAPDAVTIQQVAEGPFGQVRTTRSEAFPGLDAAYSAADLIDSIGSRVAVVPKINDPGSAPPDGDNGLILDVADYALGLASQQLNAEDWVKLASTCDDFVDAISQVTWSGEYVDSEGDKSTWDQTDNIVNTASDIKKWCKVIGTMTTAN